LKFLSLDSASRISNSKKKGAVVNDIADNTGDRSSKNRYPQDIRKAVSPYFVFFTPGQLSDLLGYSVEELKRFRELGLLIDYYRFGNELATTAIFYELQDILKFIELSKIKVSNGNKQISPVLPVQVVS
jgi:hypothetical protein